MNQHRIYVGTAGWSISRSHDERFGTGPSHLARYATQFTAVEINSSFYRSHQPTTYARWAEATPDPFRFAIKAPRDITHTRRLLDSGELLDRFFAEVRALDSKLGPVLVQLPPSLDFNPITAAVFWRELRDRFKGPVVCEPRHPSWFGTAAEQLLITWEVACVAADPAPALHADEPGGWSGLRYLRLHGSPRRYYDAYSDMELERVADQLVNLADHASVWCIFDNTAAGAATPNAFRLLELLGTRR
jgi:uncharacterized protein YecE (DUF72 family)